MKRREFLMLVSSAAAWPTCGAAQQRKQLVIGILGASSPLWPSWNAAFVQRLRELEWIEGRTIAIEYRRAEDRPEHFAEVAAEFVRRKVNVIVTFGSAVAAAKRATSTIPIVFPIANDPVGSGLVANLARPGGNVTGLSIQARDLAGKRLELLREIRPDLRRLIVIADAGYRDAVLVVDELQTAARTLGIDVVKLLVRRSDEIPSSLARYVGTADAIYVVVSALVAAQSAKINSVAATARLPTMYNNRDYVSAGGLMSYGPSYPDLFRRAADIVDKILRGTNPGDIPVEQPTTFELVINLKTAKALGLTVPPTLLARAEEVIE